MPSLPRTAGVVLPVLLLTAAALVPACSAQGGQRPPSAAERTSSMATGPDAASPTTAGSPSPTDRTAGLDSRQLAGRRIVYSYPGPTPSPTVLRAIREGRAAGVILFGENVTSPEQLKSAVGELRQAAAEAPDPRPLLLLTDQEGGQVRRLPGAPVLSARRTGASADPVGEAARSGAGAARTVADAGLNVNLAPVLDVYDAPDNFIDHRERSYGQDPAFVARLGSAFLTAQQDLGVAATAKHFPGLGSAPGGLDTDEGPVTLPVPLADLRARGEEPYRAAIAAGVRLVMTSWAVYPALDPDRPAGFSPAVVQGELRDRLGFRGVTVTDALEAGALAPYGDTGARALASAGAGMDLLLCSARDAGQGEAAATALATALDAGGLDRTAFLESVRRIDALRDSVAGS
ncbi:beta-N-acetylhexosaminidase [Kitasatospora sp. NBC_01246]|uniref:glycoside hydrolase family 3 N-terminal domain-containing protein n=1 Tax=Kitasatospora sp. NBC_01246 TaxID=2903570 RepID=UPI002E37C8D9|nr:glycoside hydrolase family 3 N-terminal domain-containing protein [Kitasatospora sp. NBC_01246]